MKACGDCLRTSHETPFAQNSHNLCKECSSKRYKEKQLKADEKHSAVRDQFFKTTAEMVHKGVDESEIVEAIEEQVRLFDANYDNKKIPHGIVPNYTFEVKKRSVHDSLQNKYILERPTVQEGMEI